jgi:hypothetical protein
MSLQPIRDSKEYSRIKESLRSRFEAEKTGDQQLFEDQTKILQPLINVQKDNSKQLQAITSANEATTAALVPMTQVQRGIQAELQRRNDALAAAQLPAITAAAAPVATTSAAADKPISIDFNAGLDEKDLENLQDMSLDTPLEIYQKQNYAEAFEKVKQFNRSIGQLLGTASKETPRHKEIYESRRQTLLKYKEKITGLASASQFVHSTPDRTKRTSSLSTPTHIPKRNKALVLLDAAAAKAVTKSGHGLDMILYKDVDDLCQRLSLLVAGKQAGNTGLDNGINSILDELLRTESISKDEYNNLYSKIFS